MHLMILMETNLEFAVSLREMEFSHRSRRQSDFAKSKSVIFKRLSRSRQSYCNPAQSLHNDWRRLIVVNFNKFFINSPYFQFLFHYTIASLKVSLEFSVLYSGPPGNLALKLQIPSPGAQFPFILVSNSTAEESACPPIPFLLFPSSPLSCLPYMASASEPKKKFLELQLLVGEF
jgi:hypothetical protein